MQRSYQINQTPRGLRELNPRETILAELSRDPGSALRWSKHVPLVEPLCFTDVHALRLSVPGALAAFALSCLAVSVPALALEPGVHADPGSPAAKQYALPLNQARQTGAGPTGHEGSSANVPFGAGIKPPGAGGSSHSGAGAGQSVGRGGASGPNAANSSGRQSTLPSAVLRASSSQASSAGGDGSILALLGGAVAILILGGFGGALMRRSRQSLPTA